MWKGKVRHLEGRRLEAERPALGSEKESLLKPGVYNLPVLMCLKIVKNNPEPKFSFEKCDMQIDSSQIYMKCINEHRFFYWLKEKSRIFYTDLFQRSLLTPHLVYQLRWSSHFSSLELVCPWHPPQRSCEGESSSMFFEWNICKLWT